jgi:hypothetical protein
LREKKKKQGKPAPHSKLHTRNVNVAWCRVTSMICIQEYLGTQCRTFIVERRCECHLLGLRSETCRVDIFGEEIRLLEMFFRNCNLNVRSNRGVIIEGHSYPCNRPLRPIVLWDVEAPIFSRKSAHRWR